mgnify:CR=1 FL=1
MPPFAALLILSFTGSLASIMLSRGVYFFAEQVFRFDKAQNLWMGLGSGAAYIVGAMPSHAFAHRLGERRLILLLIVAQVAVMAAMGVHTRPWLVVGGLLVFQVLNGMMWPVVESYVGAGRSPVATSKALGHFNVTWCSTVPVGMIITGVIVEEAPRWLFISGAILFVITLALAGFIAARPAHIEHDHPDRPPASQMLHFRALLISSRWVMLYSYTLLFLLLPMMPALFKELGHSTAGAAALGSTFDWLRVFTFIGLGVYVGWHSRAGLQWLTIVLLPAGFIPIMLGTLVFKSTLMVIFGAAVFGFAAGLAYYAALYYAMVVKNAAVDAGGGHEAFIGLGYTLGPAVGLIGHYVGQMNNVPYEVGMIGGIVVLVIICTIGAVRPLLASRRGE